MLSQLKHILEQIAVYREQVSQSELVSLVEAAKLRQTADELMKKYGGLDVAPPRDADRIRNWLAVAQALESQVKANRRLVEALETRIGRQHDLLVNRFSLPLLGDALQLLDQLEGAALTPAEIENLPTTAVV